MPNSFAERARALVGCAFRPQGRDPATGLDCIGLIIATFGVPVGAAPRDYRLRGAHQAQIASGLGAFFRRIPAAEKAAGDVALYAVAPDQCHLAVQTDSGFVHADARLRRVVETPGEAPWPILSLFRRRVRRRRKG